MSDKEVNIGSAVKYNSAAVKSFSTNPRRKKFFCELDKIPFDQLVDKYCSPRKSLLLTLKRHLKAVLG